MKKKKLDQNVPSKVPVASHGFDNIYNTSIGHSTHNPVLHQDSRIHPKGRFFRETVRPTTRTHIMIETVDEEKSPSSAPHRNNRNDCFDYHYYDNCSEEPGIISQAYAVHPNHNSHVYSYDPSRYYEGVAGSEPGRGSGSIQQINEKSPPYNPNYVSERYYKC